MDDPNQQRLIDLADQKWRLNNLYWITDKEGERVQFKLNWAQAELLDDLHYLNIILKARQLGFTTFIQIFMLDMSVFYKNTRCGVIAQTLSDAQTIFRDKIKYPYDSLPDLIKAQAPIVTDNRTELFLGNNSELRVGTSLRGGTLQFLHVSEFGKICAKFPERAREIVTGAFNTIQAGQMAFIESTAEGQDGKFYEMCQKAEAKKTVGAKLTVMDWKFHFYPWWREPLYIIDPDGVVITKEMADYFAKLEREINVTLTEGQKAWYIKKYEDQDEDMGREYPGTPAEAFAAAIEGAYYAKQIMSARVARRIGRVPYESDLKVETWWDLGMDDSTAITLVQRFNREIRLIGYYENSGEGLSHYTKYLDDLGYRYERHILPHDVRVRELGTGVSREETLGKLGLKNIIVAPQLEIIDGIEAVRSQFSRFYIDEENCEQLVKCLTNYRKEWNEDLGVWRNKPLHNWASHGADSVRTGAVAPPPMDASVGKLEIPKIGAI